MEGLEEKETMCVSVMCHMKIYSDTKLSDRLFAGLAALRKCQHNTEANNIETSTGLISLPSSPTLTALPFSAILRQCQTLIVVKMTGFYTLWKIHKFSFPCLKVYQPYKMN